MNYQPRLLGITSICATVLTMSALIARADEAILKGTQATEQAMIDALSIGDPTSSADGKTRGFRPPPKTNGREASTAAKSSGKLHLLMTFETNSAVLTSETMAVLDTLAAAMKSDQLAGNTFNIEGHADARGELVDNQKLSLLRASSVVEYLAGKHAILMERLVPIGKGSGEPMNKTKVDAPENRRVTIVTNKY